MSQGVISIVQGGSAHATLVGRRNRKLVISGVSFLERSGGGYLVHGQALNEGLGGDVYTLDGNSKAISPHGGKIFKGKLDIINKRKEKDSGINQRTKGGIDLNPNISNMEILKNEKGYELKFNNLQVISPNVQGLIPVIIQIIPATNIPMLLGVKEDQTTDTLSFVQ